jgi:hypothetical protein
MANVPPTISCLANDGEGEKCFIYKTFSSETFLNLFFFLRSPKKKYEKSPQLWKWKHPVELIQL